MRRVSGVYEIVCGLTGHRYIGSSKNIEKRWGRHRECLRNGTHHNGWLQRAWVKYGEAAFLFRILEVCGDDRVAREQHHMDGAGKKLKNASKIAHCAVWTDDQRRKMSILSKKMHAEGRCGAVFLTDDGRRRMSESARRIHTGRKITQTTRAKMRQSQKAHWKDPAKKAIHKRACEEHARSYWTPERRAEQSDRARKQMTKQWEQAK